MESKRCYGCMQVKTSSPICEHCGYDERTPNAPHQLPPGTILQGKYLIGKVLGQGGFGITYLGRDINLDIPVAIKEYYPTGMVMRESIHSCTVSVVTGQMDSRFTENRERFLREARTLARLQDVPEVVQVMNFFSENNTAYIIMGYVRGITLKEHMRRRGGRLSAGETFRLLEPLMEALGQVHELGLVHRDISPDNIMLQPNKRARLIDFGAAHAATAAGDKSTQAVLKHGFAPMEQYQSRGQLGAWTDVYAMCATIYHCLTGMLPPNATDRVMGMEEFQWDAITGLTPEQLTTLKKGLSLSHTQRIQTMQELCEGFFGKEDEEDYLPEKKSSAGKTEEPATVLQHPEEELPETRKVNREPVSPTGTVALLRSEEPASYTAPVESVQIKGEPAKNEPYTVPVDQRETPVVNVTTPVEREPEKKPDSKQKDRKSETDNRPKAIFAIAAIVLFFVIVLLGLVLNRKKPDESVYVPPKDAQSASTQAKTQADTSRVLLDHDDLTQSAFRTGIPRDQILSVTILNTTFVPSDAVDVSKKQDRSVLAWVKPRKNMYDLYLAANGTIIAPENCQNMFYGFSNATEFNLSGLDTGNVTSMRSMFSGCSSLKELDLSGFDTGNVTDMSFMFSRCSSLEELNVSDFDTKNVTNMAQMFCDTPELNNVNGNFDTRNVENYYMFMEYRDTFNGIRWEKLFQ